MAIRVLIFLFSVSIPLIDMTRYFMGLGSLAEVVLVVLLLVALLKSLISGKLAQRVLMSSTSMFVLMWFLISLLSWIWSGAEDSMRILRIMEYAAVYISVSIICVKSDASNSFIMGTIWGGVLASLICLVHWILGPSYYFFQNWAGIDEGWYYSVDNFRVHGSFGNPLNTVMYLSVVAGLVYMKIHGTRVNRSGWIIVIGLMIFSAQLTGSKSSLIAPLVLLVIERKFKIIAFIAIMGLVAYFLGAFDTLILRLFMRGSFEGSVNQRLYVISSSISMIWDNFWLGVGPGRFADEYLNFKHPYASSALSSFTAENQVLQYAAEIGVLGASMLVMAYWRGVATGMSRTLRRLRGGIMLIDEKNMRAVTVGLIIFAAISMIQSATSADLSMLLFSMIGFQQAQIVRAKSKLKFDRLTPNYEKSLV